MKKNLLLLLALAACVVSCNRQPKPTASDKDIDVVIADHGALSFYNAATQKVSPFTAETDSVVNMQFTDNTHLYYTVAINGNLSLKMIDLSATPIEPVLCADWGQTVDDAMDFEFGKMSDLYIDACGDHVYIYGFDPDNNLMTPIAYNFETRQIESLSDDELFHANYLYEKPFASHFYTQHYLFYYVCPEGKSCLNDRIDVKPYFEFDLDDTDFTFDPEAISPDGQKVVFNAMVFWGEGTGIYCMANADGTSQRVIEDSDTRYDSPVWLPDGSLLYVGKAPDTDEPCVKRIDPNGQTQAVTAGSMIAARPTIPETDKEHQGGLENCDVATFDNGRVTFYNSTTGQFVPFVAEQDSVINGAFDDMDGFFYTVKIGDSLYLKEVYLYNYSIYPIMLAAWNLSIDDCVSQTYGKAADLFCLTEQDRVGLFYAFSWDSYDFSKVAYYDFVNQEIIKEWIGDEGDVDVDADAEEGVEAPTVVEEKPHFVITDNGLCYEEEGRLICLCDQINFKDYCSDPDYFSDPEFQSISIDPTNRFAVYYSYIEWGDLGHGPLCIASLDGTMQRALKDTDSADVTCGWLSDGSLLYTTTTSKVRIARPDGTDAPFTSSTGFVVKGMD